MKTGDLLDRLQNGEPRAIARAISLVEDQSELAGAILQGLDKNRLDQALVVGITGPPGVGKSTLTSKLIRQLRLEKVRVGIIAVDPSSPLTGGAILGDRIRMMDHALDPDVVVRSMATRGRLGGLCASAGAAVRVMAGGGCQVILIETVGIGQSEMDIVGLADLTIMVLAPGFGDDIQAMKAGILEVADLLVINKTDLQGGEKLVLDLSTLFSSHEEKERRIIKTIAHEDQGVGVLLQRIYEHADILRENGTFLQKRKRAFELETIDWVLELLRDRAQNLIAKKESIDRDPRLAATNIMRELIAEDLK